MKSYLKIILFIAMMWMIPSTVLVAQTGFMPNATPAQTVAMVYHKMSNVPPNFKKWALMTKDYAAASKFDKVMVRDKKAAEFQAAFSLVSTTEAIVIRTPVYLSRYSFANKGFLIQSFREDTYFSYEYGGDAYAIVIPDLIEYQWVGAEEAAAKKIDDEAKLAKGSLKAILYFEPKFADKSAPMTLDGKKYWLLSGKVRNIALYASDGKTILWQKMSKTYSDKKQRELLNLYQ